MKNPYKKFQNSSMHLSKVMLCIKKRDKQKDKWTNTPEAICPSNFFKVGGINMVLLHSWIQEGYPGNFLSYFSTNTIYFGLSCPLKKTFWYSLELLQFGRQFYHIYCKYLDSLTPQPTCLNPGPEPKYALPLQTVQIQVSWLLRSQLTWICTVCNSVCEVILIICIKWSDLLKIWSGRGILIYSARQGLKCKQVHFTMCLKTVEWMANSVMHSPASDLGLHCLLRSVYLSI